MFNILTPAEVSAQIPVLAKSLRDNEDQIHIIAVSTLDHAREFGDFRGTLALLNALPKGTRSEGLAAWYRAHSTNKLSLKRDPVSKVWTGDIRKDRVDADFKMDEARAITFADFTTETAPKQLTLAKFLGSIEKVANDTTILPNGARKVPFEVAEVASQLLHSLRASAA